MKTLEKFAIEAMTTFCILLGIGFIGAVVFAVNQVITGNVPQTVCLGY